MAGIKLKNIRKSYQVEDRNVPVLNGIDLDNPQGQITVILGQIGCGKTTLLTPEKFCGKEITRRPLCFKSLG